MSEASAAWRGALGRAVAALKADDTDYSFRCECGFSTRDTRYEAHVCPTTATPDEGATTCQHLDLSMVRESGDVGAVAAFTCTKCRELFDVEAAALLFRSHSVEAGRRWRADRAARGEEPTT